MEFETTLPASSSPQKLSNGVLKSLTFQEHRLQMDAASEINATLRAEQMGAAPKSGGLPRKKIDAKMAAAKRKAREAKAKGNTGGSSIALPALMALSSALLFGLYRGVAPEHKSLDPLSLTAPRVLLEDGRHLAWHETGAKAEVAKFHVLVLHDIKGCRLSMLPNVSEDWLVSNGIRLVSYDRPGYGQSDAFPLRSATSEAKDVELASRDLSLPKKFYIVSLGIASYAAWGMLSSITNRLAGVALVSPWGSFLAPGLDKTEKFDAWHSIPRSERLQHLAARLGPWGVSALAKASDLLGPDWVPSAEVPAWAKVNSSVLDSVEGSLPNWAADGLKEVLYVAGAVDKPGAATSPGKISDKDVAVLQSKPVAEYLNLTGKEALLQGAGESMFRDWAVAVSPWGFDLSDVKAAVEGVAVNRKPRLVLWQGSEDKIVPAVFTKYAKRSVPLLDVREAKGSGHYFYLESDEWPKTILSGLLELKEGAAEEHAEVI